MERTEERRFFFSVFLLFKMLDVDKSWISHFNPASLGVNERLFGMSLIISGTTRPSSTLIPLDRRRRGEPQGLKGQLIRLMAAALI